MPDAPSYSPVRTLLRIAALLDEDAKRLSDDDLHRLPKMIDRARAEGR